MQSATRVRSPAKDKDDVLTAQAFVLVSLIIARQPDDLSRSENMRTMLSLIKSQALFRGGEGMYNATKHAYSDKDTAVPVVVFCDRTFIIV